MWHKFTSLMSPKGFAKKTAPWMPWLGSVAFVSLSYGLFAGLLGVPADYQQGDAFRIIYVHVPCAMLSLSLYFAMAACSFSTYMWRIKVADMLAEQCAFIGATFTFLALTTGAIWGKPMWGAWWIWDGRLTSELVLFFLYGGIIGLRSAINDTYKASRACALLSMVGVINLPIIHYSVTWWHTLHQKSTLLGMHQPTMAHEMLWPLLASMAGFSLLAAWLLIQNVRIEIHKSISARKREGVS